jgi:hypothetical protein
MSTTSTGGRSVDSQSTCFGRLLRPLYQKRKVTLAFLGKNQSLISRGVSDSRFNHRGSVAKERFSNFFEKSRVPILHHPITIPL